MGDISQNIWEINGKILLIIFIVLGVAALGLVILLVANAFRKKAGKKAIGPKKKPLTYRQEFDKLPKEQQDRIEALVAYGLAKQPEGIEAKEKTYSLNVYFKKYQVCKVTIKGGVTKFGISVQNPILYKEALKLKPLTVECNAETESSIKSAIDVSYSIYKKL